METERTDDLNLKDLNQYYGTEQYHNLFMNVTGTDGIFYIINNGYSWFVSDACVILKMKAEVKSEEFVCIDLKLLDNKKAVVIYTDGNEKVLFKQEYEYTDAQKEIKLFYTNEVLMLSGEY
jgi:hypothetical protein